MVSWAVGLRSGAPSRTSRPGPPLGRLPDPKHPRTPTTYGVSAPADGHPVERPSVVTFGRAFGQRVPQAHRHRVSGAVRDTATGIRTRPTSLANGRFRWKCSRSNRWRTALNRPESGANCRALSRTSSGRRPGRVRSSSGRRRPAGAAHAAPRSDTRRYLQGRCHLLIHASDHRASPRRRASDFRPVECSNGSGDALDGRGDLAFQYRAERNWYVGNCHAAYRCLEGVEGLFGDDSCDL